MTHALVEALAPIMPEGTLSLLCGSVGDLLDHVEWADVIAFTGSADTGEKIRSHPQVLRSGAAVNIEADSLNSMILDPDAEDATYDAFIRHAHTEITQKSGQKCTAVRRLLVPRERLDEVIEDLIERFGRTVVGDPTLDGVTMGPLCTPSQKQAALEGLGILQEHAKVIYGGPDGELKSQEGVDLSGGAFVCPTLLQTEGPCQSDSPIHNLEVFGPVSTIIPFDGSAAEAVEQVRYGQGCLVSSIYADNSKFLKESILGLAAWHGRLVVVDEQVAEKALAPGLVTPQLLHGGPGRAGGGEELGGLRGMKLYQQRCAIQGNGPKLSRLIKG
jgi:phenylacetic acid degradation protein PaaN